VKAPAHGEKDRFRFWLLGPKVLGSCVSICDFCRAPLEVGEPVP